MQPDMACWGLFGVSADLRDLGRCAFNLHHSPPMNEAQQSRVAQRGSGLPRRYAPLG
jgi:hypothetical protein